MRKFPGVAGSGMLAFIGSGDELVAMKPSTAKALWYEPPGVTLREEPLSVPRAGEALVRTVFSGISRGTERLVLHGLVPQSEWQRMRAPLQQGEFPGPVKYGYCAVGEVVEGPDALSGRLVFCLHPHQDHFIAPVNMLHPIPDGVPARRATLAANMETALNALWDAGAGPCDRIVVIGGGTVGLLVGVLAARLPGAHVVLSDILPTRAALARTLGIVFAAPEDVPGEADIAFHASGTAEGLELALRCAGFEARVIELSWYGDTRVSLPLGQGFHAGRLSLISSQVGMVAPSRRPRWPHERRLAAALALLRNPRLDALVPDEIDFLDAPRLLPEVLHSSAGGLPPVIRYQNE
jgi:NADPH:quinone reductase-like Zn-dependent oxidoreductase